MHLHRVQVKLFVENADALEASALIPIFHRWIQQRELEELLIDVADYAHVPQGPSVVLIAHEADYAVDFTHGRAGLLYTRKRDVPPDPTDAVRLALGRALDAAVRLENETDLVFRRDEIELGFPDRLRVPNRPESLELVRPLVETALAERFPGAVARIEATAYDERLPFGVRSRLTEAAAY